MWLVVVTDNHPHGGAYLYGPFVSKSAAVGWKYDMRNFFGGRIVNIVRQEPIEPFY